MMPNNHPMSDFISSWANLNHMYALVSSLDAGLLWETFKEFYEGIR